MRRPCPPNDSSKNRIDHNSLRWKKITRFSGKFVISVKITGISYPSGLFFAIRLGSLSSWPKRVSRSSVEVPPDLLPLARRRFSGRPSKFLPGRLEGSYSEWPCRIAFRHPHTS